MVSLPAVGPLFSQISLLFAPAELGQSFRHISLHRRCCALQPRVREPQRATLGYWEPTTSYPEGVTPICSLSASTDYMGTTPSG